MSHWLGRLLKWVLQISTTDRTFTRWVKLENPYAVNRVFETTYRTYWIFGFLPIWRRLIKLVEIPVWLQIQRMTLGE